MSPNRNFAATRVAICRHDDHPDANASTSCNPARGGIGTGRLRFPLRAIAATVTRSACADDDERGSTVDCARGIPDHRAGTPASAATVDTHAATDHNPATGRPADDSARLAADLRERFRSFGF